MSLDMHDPAAGINKRYLKTAKQVAGLELQPKWGVRELKGGAWTLFLEEFLKAPLKYFPFALKKQNDVLG